MSDLALSLEKILTFLFRAPIGSDAFNLLVVVTLLAGILTTYVLFGVFNSKVGLMRSSLGFVLSVLGGLVAYAWMDVLAQRFQVDPELAHRISFIGMALGAFLSAWVMGRLVWQQGILLACFIFSLSIAGAGCVGILTDSCYRMVQQAQGEVKEGQEPTNANLDSL